MILYALTIAVSAFLLFLVQPIIAKQILPWFGGSAAVWTTCMVFFQLVLLAGYFYSDWIVRKLDTRRQAIVHTVLLVVALAFLPITPSEAMKPADAEQPALRILLLLASTIGLPYLMLSTTGPLVQAWFTRRFEAGQVYRLYSLSNVASMLALILYPPVIEPWASARTQSVGWSAGFALFVALAIGAAWAAARAVKARSADGPGAGTATGATGEASSRVADHVSGTAAGPAPAPTLREQALWLTLAALGSLMLLAVTTHITQNVASIPFLWVLPLALYLISFILCFDGKGWYWPRIYLVAACAMVVLMMGGLTYRPADGWKGVEEGLLHLEKAVPLYAAGLFVLCMYCHGELVARKPAPAHLTRFYLMVSLGGAVGGLLVGVIAPMVFDWYWEFPVALAALALLAVLLARRWWRLPALAAAIASIALFVAYSQSVHENTIELSRDFYGTLRVKASGAGDEASNRLMHGVIVHGEQFTSDKRRREITTYYGESAGVGRAIMGLRAIDGESRPQHIGLIGLGVGTLAGYGRAGDQYRIYELNPQVLELARRRFSFLGDSKATIATPLGDARLVLEREPDQRFDLLAVDAFSSDSIPVHLITREAAKVYRRHLRADGVIAFHISNRYLDLTGVTRQLADELGMQAVRVVDDPGDDSDLYRSDWVLLTANTALVERLTADRIGSIVPVKPGLKPWTDDYNNLFAVLK